MENSRVLLIISEFIKSQAFRDGLFCHFLNITILIVTTEIYIVINLLTRGKVEKTLLYVKKVGHRIAMRLNRGFVNSCCKQGRNWTLVNSITSLPNYTGLQFCQKKHYSSTRSPHQRPSVIILFSNILIFNVILRPCMGTEFNSMIIYVSVNND